MVNPQYNIIEDVLELYNQNLYILINQCYPNKFNRKKNNLKKLTISKTYLSFPLAVKLKDLPAIIIVRMRNKIVSHK